MRTVLSGLLCLALAACAAQRTARDASHPSPRETLSLDRILSSPPLAGAAPSTPSWSPDSGRIAFRWGGQSGSRREIWIVEADGTGLRPVTQDGAAGVSGFAWLPDGRGLVYLRDDGLWRVDLAGDARRLAPVERGASDLAVSPDGRHASLLQSGDLWLFDLTGSAQGLQRATSVGRPPLSDVPLGRYRRPDVEIGSYVWGGPTYAWSPDSRRIAVHQVDRSALPAVPFPHYLGAETDPNLVRRSYPGGPNERRTVAIYDVANGTLSPIDLPAPTETRVASFSWSPFGRLLLDRESDTAVDRWLHVLDPQTGELREIWHDARESRVYTTVGSAWHGDGEHVIVLADLADRYGLYVLAPGGTEPRRITAPSFDVTGGPICAANGAIFYTSNAPSPYERHVHRTSLRGEAVRLTRLPGEARPFPSPDGAHVALIRSDDRTPPDLFLADVSGERAEVRITRSAPDEFDRHEWADVHYQTFPSLVDDVTLHARVLKPRRLEPGHRYPVLFGPVYSNTVRNRWAGRYGLVQQLLVQRGFIVVQVDVRGSTGYGRRFREQFLMDFAGRDLEDLASAVAHVESLPYVDPERIGIWGSSYGGTLTVYALLRKPGLFDAGVACAAAVDPHFFGSDDVAIVRRPDSHPDAFARGAAQYAANLEDPLLLIHGMQDQVVPFKTIVVLAEELMRQGKDFDVAFAPAGTHGWTGPRHYAKFLLGKLIDHFERHLGAP